MQYAIYLRVLVLGPKPVESETGLGQLYPGYALILALAKLPG